MGEADAALVQNLVHEEIRRRIESAANDGGLVRSWRTAAQIGMTYPNSGMTDDEIAEAINRAAVKAGVALEIGRPT